MFRDALFYNKLEFITTDIGDMILETGTIYVIFPKVVQVPFVRTLPEKAVTIGLGNWKTTSSLV